MPCTHGNLDSKEHLFTSVIDGSEIRCSCGLHIQTTRSIDFRDQAMFRYGHMVDVFAHQLDITHGVEILDS